MELVMSTRSFEGVKQRLSSDLRLGSELPGMVFRERFSFFRFMMFDELLSPELFLSLKEISFARGEMGTISLSAIRPDPVRYFHRNFGFFGAVEFGELDDEDEFLHAINDYPKRDSADSLSSNAERVAYGVSSGAWAAYGDRINGIGICAFENGLQSDSLARVHGSEFVFDATYAADLLYGNETSRTRADQLILHYS